MILSSKDKKHGLPVNLKMLHKLELKEFNNQNKVNKNGETMPNKPKKLLMLNF
jgi:hypothetical protein